MHETVRALQTEIEGAEDALRKGNEIVEQGEGRYMVTLRDQISNLQKDITELQNLSQSISQLYSEVESAMGRIESMHAQVPRFLANSNNNTPRS